MLVIYCCFQVFSNRNLIADIISYMRVNKNNLLIGYKKTRVGALVLGVLVSFYATITAFANFYQYEGTIFKIKDCILPNPVTTPCFWGALAFLAAFILAVKNLKKSSAKFEKYFMYFMVACVLFAWGNFAIELKGVEPTPGALIAPCPASGKNPFLTPCFFGSILFTASLILSLKISRITSEGG